MTYYKKIKIFMIVLVSLFIITSCSDDNSSSTEPPDPPEPVAWENFINQNNILSSEYDKTNKVIWIGTENGLLKYDVTDFEPSKVTNP